ncbi:type II toxin-antitoxin system VapB family antitoxin [Phenylobacterium aquaticum]|uniref:type II toxin-antitoxin system VapB family antitoxin n=1 Tax=Phenylobacterium aquaticum TaxID=1763816 RepID=UPI001F5D0264|nr:type II toxin-antitoxin system VapB family antitoxin [Phenylobacterium aquaticum]MCI3131272.1 type II toxin-antitoxin system VapB family antitoxin [Phenylobacterium aquaticum]
MALSIKTAEADQLARELSRLTGETMTEAVTRALADRLAKVRAAQETDADLPGRLRVQAAELATRYDLRPVTKREWDAGWDGGE